MLNIDITKSPEENLLLLIKANNPSLVITPEQFTFGAVSVDTSIAGKNSALTMTAVANAGFSGTKTIRWQRLGMDSGVASVPAAVSINPSDTQEQIKQKVAAALGLKYDQLTITGSGAGGNIDIPENEDDTSVTVEVAPIAGSLLYVGASLEIQITIPDTDVSLEDAITVGDLDGFTPVA